ncbi:MAG: U32 family peptidase [Gammaproteobacteria bacterium]|nr:U32 family peptidase [Gammaproteobacteria bacterium]
MELVCPAGNLPAFKEALENGADAIYTGFRDDTNARHFSGLNFNDKKLARALSLARDKSVKIYIAINTYPQPDGWKRWQSAIDMAADLGVDAVIVADIGVLGYAAGKHPSLNLHLSVQASATNAEALNFYHNQFGIRRAVLPRVLSIKQVKMLAQHSPVDLEVFGFGSLCIMAEGRCHLSSYLTGESPNMNGVCSPARFVDWKETGDILEARLNGVLIDRFQPGEKAGYPTLCKGRYEVEGQLFHALEEPTSLNTLDVLPELADAGIKAVKIEGRQRSPAYIREVVKTWREALNRYQQAPDDYRVEPRWMQNLSELSEGSQTTLGAYHRPWQ